MSDQNDDLDTDEEDSQSDSSPKGLRQALKAANAQAKANAEAAAELAELKRQVTFRDVGLDPTKPQHHDFIKAYDGELTEAAIREAAQSRGYLETEVPSDEVLANMRMNRASVGSETASGTPENDAMRALLEAKNAAEISQVAAHYGFLDTNQ